MFRWKLLVTLALSLPGCPGFGDKTLAELEGITEVPTYEADIKPILATYCTGCHADPPAAGAPQPLITYDQAVADAERIRVRSVQLGDMPPGGGMADNDRALLEAWVLNGAPEGEADADAEKSGLADEPHKGDDDPRWLAAESEE